LYDLALLAAAHVCDDAVLVYDVYVSDPEGGKRHAQLWRDDMRVLEWWDSDYRIVAPVELAGMKLNELRAWIDTLEPLQQEAARILQWGSLIAHGRIIPMEMQSDASRMPATCFSFQPEQARLARRIGQARDFSAATAQPLELQQESA
jgi:hypothetical protein